MAVHGELRVVLFGEETELVVIDYFKGDHGLLAIEKMCKRCDTEMHFNFKTILPISLYGDSNGKAVRPTF